MPAFAGSSTDAGAGVATIASVQSPSGVGWRPSVPGATSRLDSLGGGTILDFRSVGFLWQMNIFGGPALTREQFQSFVPQTFSSFHLLVTTPIGFYQPSSPINPSGNRWMISPTVNFSYTPDQGWTWLETYVSGRIFTDNGNYLVNGAQTLTQRPLLRLEEHLSRNVTDALYQDPLIATHGCRTGSALADNVHRSVRLGAPVLISESWYYGSRRTLITISVERRASMGSTRTTWRTRFRSEREWGFVCGAAPIWGSNYERVVAKPASEPYRKPCD